MQSKRANGKPGRLVRAESEDPPPKRRPIPKALEASICPKSEIKTTEEELIVGIKMSNILLPEMLDKGEMLSKPIMRIKRPPKTANLPPMPENDMQAEDVLDGMIVKCYRNSELFTRLASIGKEISRRDIMDLVEKTREHYKVGHLSVAKLEEYHFYDWQAFSDNFKVVIQRKRSEKSAQKPDTKTKRDATIVKMVLVEGSSLKQAAAVSRISICTASKIVKSFLDNRQFKSYRKAGRKKSNLPKRELAKYLKVKHENRGFLALTFKDLLLDIRNSFPLLTELSDTTMIKFLREDFDVRVGQVSQKAVGVDYYEQMFVRRAIAKKLLTYLIEDALVIFVDESAIQPANFKSTALGLKGYPIEAEVLGCGLNVNILLAISQERLEAIQILDRRVNKSAFMTFMETVFSEVMARQKESGRTVVVCLDNLSLHHSDGFKRLVYSYRIKLIYTCPHSPVLNMAEGFFLLVKNSFRQATKINKAKALESINSLLIMQKDTMEAKTLSVFLTELAALN